MPLSEEDEQAIDRGLQLWRQGDVSLDAGLEFFHLADLSRPHSPASVQATEALVEEGEAIETTASPVLDEVRGLVMLSQTCDVIRNCRARPFVEVAPLVEVPELWVEEIRRLKRPAFAHVPATAGDRLVADLDRTMTVEKAIVAGWTRTPGWQTDEELRDFAQALARKRSRFAFPDDFVVAASGLQAHMVARHNRRTVEGAHLRALREIRVRAAPSWAEREVQLTWWFVKDDDPVDAPANLARFPRPLARAVRPDRPVPPRSTHRLPPGGHDGARLRRERPARPRPPVSHLTSARAERCLGSFTITRSPELLRRGPARPAGDRRDVLRTKIRPDRQSDLWGTLDGPQHTGTKFTRADETACPCSPPK